MLENARRRWPAVRFEVRERRRAGRARGPAGRRRPCRSWTRDAEVDVIVSRAAAAAWRTCCRSPTRRWSGRSRLPYAGGHRDRPRAGHPAARPGRRPARLHADRRGARGSCRTSARSWTGSPSCADRRAAAVGALSTARSAGCDALRSRPVAGRPATGWSTRAPSEVATAARPRPGARSGTGSTARPTSWRTPARGSGPSRPPRRWSAATRCVQRDGRLAWCATPDEVAAGAAAAGCGWPTGSLLTRRVDGVAG